VIESFLEEKKREGLRFSEKERIRKVAAERRRKRGHTSWGGGGKEAFLSKKIN